MTAPLSRAGLPLTARRSSLTPDQEELLAQVGRRLAAEAPPTAPDPDMNALLDRLNGVER